MSSLTSKRCLKSECNKWAFVGSCFCQEHGGIKAAENKDNHERRESQSLRASSDSIYRIELAAGELCRYCLFSKPSNTLDVSSWNMNALKQEIETIEQRKNALQTMYETYNSQKDIEVSVHIVVAHVVKVAERTIDAYAIRCFLLEQGTHGESSGETKTSSISAHENSEVQNQLNEIEKALKTIEMNFMENPLNQNSQNENLDRLLEQLNLLIPEDIFMLQRRNAAWVLITRLKGLLYCVKQHQNGKKLSASLILDAGSECELMPIEWVNTMGFNYETGDRNESYSIENVGTKADLVLDLSTEMIHAGVLFYDNKFKAVDESYNFCLFHRIQGKFIMFCTNSEFVIQHHDHGICRYKLGKYIRIPMGSTLCSVVDLMETLNELAKKSVKLPKSEHVIQRMLTNPDHPHSTNCLHTAFTVLVCAKVLESKEEIFEKMIQTTEVKGVFEMIQQGVELKAQLTESDRMQRNFVSESERLNEVRYSEQSSSCATTSGWSIVSE